MIRTLLISAAVLLVQVSTARAQEGARRDEPPEAPPAPTLTKAPELIEAAAPEYPPQALADKRAASVTVRIHIDATGTVTKVDVVEPVGHGFDEAAVAAAMQYTFTPAEWDGVPGPIAVETAIHFVIQEQEEPPPPPLPPPPSSEETRDEAAQGPPAHGGDYRLPVTISGQAVERGSRRSLAGVIVAVAELGLDAVTDDQGNFYFHGVPPGTYRIIAVDDRYDRLERTLVLTAEDKSVEVRLWMRAKGGNPYETVVEGEREVLEVTRRTLQRRQLTTVPGTFGDPIRVIQALPGMSQSPFGVGLLLVRGSNPDDSGVFIDGHRVPLIFHFLGGPSILNPEFLDEINLYPGGYPARFGRSIGGIVTVETRSSKSDGIHGAADIDLLDAGAYVRFPVGENASLAIAGRRSYLNLVLGYFVPEAYVVVPVYYDYQIRLDYDLQREGRASLFFFGSSDVLEVVSQAPVGSQSTLDVSTSVQFLRLIGTYKRPIGRDLRLTLSPVFGRDTLFVSSSQAGLDTAFVGADVTQDVLGYRMRLDGRVNKHLVIDVGMDIESRVNQYQLRVPVFDFVPDVGQVDVPPEDLVRSIDLLAYGMHADLGWNVTDDLRLVPGFRFDGYWLAGENRYALDPRLVVRYQLDEHWLVKTYGGLFHQPPQAEAFDSFIGNPSIGLERAVHAGLGAEWKPSKLWTFDAEFYFVDRYDLVTFAEQGEVDVDAGSGEVSPVNLINTGLSDTIGIEFLVKREVSRNLYGWLSYTLSRSRQQQRPDEPTTPTFFDQRHILNAVASYRFDSGWEVGGRFRLATGRPYTPIAGFTFDPEDNDHEPFMGPFLGARLETQHQLDVRVEKTWVFDYFTLGMYLDVQNLFNVGNVEGYQYDYRYRDRAPITSVPILPTIGFRGQW